MCEVYKKNDGSETAIYFLAVFLLLLFLAGAAAAGWLLTMRFTIFCSSMRKARTMLWGVGWGEENHRPVSHKTAASPTSLQRACTLQQHAPLCNTPLAHAGVAPGSAVGARDALVSALHAHELRRGAR